MNFVNVCCIQRHTLPLLVVVVSKYILLYARTAVDPTHKPDAAAVRAGRHEMRNNNVRTEDVGLTYSWPGGEAKLGGNESTSTWLIDEAEPMIHTLSIISLTLTCLLYVSGT